MKVTVMLPLSVLGSGARSTTSHIEVAALPVAGDVIEIGCRHWTVTRRHFRVDGSIAVQVK